MLMLPSGGIEGLVAPRTSRTRRHTRLKRRQVVPIHQSGSKAPVALLWPNNRPMTYLAMSSAIEDSVAGDVVRFMTLTAARPGEALGAQWENIDLDLRLWSIPGDAMKKGRAHRVPLSDAAVEVLERHYGGQASGLVFPNPRGKPMDRSVPRRLVKRMGFNAMAHGMRSTFADWCREVAKADAEARELALAHQIGDATTRAYARSALLEPRRELMQQWADFLTS